MKIKLIIRIIFKIYNNWSLINQNNKNNIYNNKFKIMIKIKQQINNKYNKMRKHLNSKIKLTILIYHSN